MEKETTVTEIEIKPEDVVKGGIKLVGSHCVSKVVEEMLRNTTGWGNMSFAQKATLWIGTKIISWCVSDYCVDKLEKTYDETSKAIKNAMEEYNERESGTENEA